MIGWCLCNTAVATASWASVDLDGFVERTTSRKGLSARLGAGSRAGSKQQPARCSRKTQDKFAIAFMAKKLLHSWIGAHTRVHMHFFCRESACIYSTMHVQGCMLDRYCEHQRTHLLHALYRMCVCDRCRYIYIWLCIGICIYVYVYVHVCVHVYVYVSMYLCMCMCMYMYTYICVCMYACECLHAYVYMCMYIYKSIYISAESLHAFTMLLSTMHVQGPKLGTYSDTGF